MNTVVFISACVALAIIALVAYICYRSEQKKAADKKAAQKEQEERWKNIGKGKDNRIDSEEEDTVTISANSVEELIAKIEEYNFDERSNRIQTEKEKQIGQNIDFWA